MANLANGLEWVGLEGLKLRQAPSGTQTPLAPFISANDTGANNERIRPAPGHVINDAPGHDQPVP